MWACHQTLTRTSSSPGSWGNRLPVMHLTACQCVGSKMFTDLRNLSEFKFILPWLSSDFHLCGLCLQHSPKTLYGTSLNLLNRICQHLWEKCTSPRHEQVPPWFHFSLLDPAQTVLTLLYQLDTCAFGILSAEFVILMDTKYYNYIVVST